MSAFLLGAINIGDPAAYAAYQRAAAVALAPYAVEFLAVDRAPVVLEGDQPAGHLFVIRFASMAEARAFYDSSAYRSARAIRLGASETVHLMLLRGTDEAA